MMERYPAIDKARHGRWRLSTADGGRKPAARRVQTEAEELLNMLTHGVGALGAVLGTVLLLRRVENGSTLAAISAAFYGACLIALYTNSAVYHGTKDPKWKKRLRVLDHCSIFLLILGSYVPVALVAIGGALGWGLVAVNATLAAVGIVSRIVTMNRGKSRLSVALYLIMGWLAVLAIRPVASAVPPVGLALLVAGGAAYTVGVIFYRSRRPYMHVVWHLFVLAGSGIHYACIFLYCCG